MVLLIFYLSLALGVSFFCSIMEAVILSITPSFVEALEQKAPKAGATLRHLKSNIDQPLAAILSLNTVAHTVGAAGVGAQAAIVFGNAYVAVISAALTFLILVFSEIIPKTLGAFYWQRLAVAAARTLPPLIWLLYPLVLLSQRIANMLSSEERMASVSREELWAMTDLARREGIFGDRESRILKNLLRVGKLRVRDVMTPRPVMFTLPADMRVEQVMEAHPELTFSRIPLREGNKDDISAFVLKSDIMQEVSRERLDTPLRELGREIRVVPEVVTLIYIFEQFLNEREHIALVVDEYGGVVGIVSMEDVVETLLGIEIVDETDSAIDMQAMARQQWTQRARALGLIPDEDAQSSRES